MKDLSGILCCFSFLSTPYSAVLFVYGILHGCETRKVFGRFVLFSLVFASVFFPAPGDRSLCNMIGVRDPSSPCIIISLLFNHF